MMRAMRILTLTAAALTLLASTLALAAEPAKKEGSFGKGGGPLLTKEQLRNCMSQKVRVGQQDDDLGKEQSALMTLKDAIARDGDALKAKLETVDRTNAEAVAAYNDQAQARDKQIDDYQARVTAFNARVDAAKTERESFAKACENRRFFEDDEIAIRKGK